MHDAHGVAHTLEGLVRLGYLAKAVDYILVGTLAFRVAAHMRGGRVTDQGGALYVVLRQPYGGIYQLLHARYAHL